jgi:hypothetical protein
MKSPRTVGFAILIAVALAAGAFVAWNWFISNAVSYLELAESRVWQAEKPDITGVHVTVVANAASQKMRLPRSPSWCSSIRRIRISKRRSRFGAGNTRSSDRAS